MINTDIPVYLASKSPRRKKLLEQLNLKFDTFSVDLDEEILDGEHPVETVKRLAKDKMNLACEEVEDALVITADTIVVLDDHVLGKPENTADAKRILNLLSGNKHYVYTGYCVINQKEDKEILEYERTEVTFRLLDNKEIEDYIASGSPMDKAGAYGIQDDFGAVFVEHINGCYYNVVGLPLAKLYKSLQSILSK